MPVPFLNAVRVAEARTTHRQTTTSSALYGWTFERFDGAISLLPYRRGHSWTSDRCPEHYCIPPTEPTSHFAQFLCHMVLLFVDIHPSVRAGRYMASFSVIN